MAVSVRALEMRAHRVFSRAVRDEPSGSFQASPSFTLNDAISRTAKLHKAMQYLEGIQNRRSL